ncbi:MAG: ATP-binding protein [Oscillospiraceae bacterium]|nr:ATP-binding protein [Oscillospiraceae bacterium]
MDNEQVATQDGGEAAPTLQSVQSELNALKRKYARLLKENENVTHLYKQAASLRDFNEKEKEVQMRYNQLLRDNSPDEIMLLDTELNILLCTSSVKMALGRDVTGESVLPVAEERFGAANADEVQVALYRMLNNFKLAPILTNSYELHVEVRGEQDSFFSITLSPALDNKGELFGVVVLAHDNTEMHDANVRAEAANQAKSAFLSTMSHEIRTPMNAILGITEIQLQNETLGPDTKEALGKIYASGDMLLGIINDILDLSKIEAGKLELLIDKYETASFISDTAQLNMMRIGSKPIEFELFVSEDLPASLSGDELRVKQILNNILSNAFKYTAEGLVSLSVSQEQSADNDGEVLLVVSVSDTGQGMTKEQVDALFDEYSRFNAEANRTTEGTGLGMSITRNLIRMMNGEISIESEPGKGSTFTVRIPQGLVDEQLLGHDVAENLRQFRTDSSASMRRVQITREPMPYGSVLIVDDVETNIYVAKGLLTPYELKIDSADSGFEAIDKVKAGNTYDIIFMDHMMPQMDGIETTQKIREMGYDRPIVALTANAVAGQADVFLGNGFDDFISKPIDVRQLNAVLNKMIRDKQSPEALAQASEQAAAGGGSGAVDSSPGVDPRLAEIFVRDAVKSFDLLEGIIGKQGVYSEDDVRAYVICVHGLKSALANMGNTDLSGIALKLEQAGRDGETGIIADETPAFFGSLQEYIAQLMPEPGDEGEGEAGDDTELLREKLQVIKAACEEYDGGIVDAAIAELREKPWSKEVRELLSLMEEHSLHSDFDEVLAAADGYLA